MWKLAIEGAADDYIMWKSFVESTVEDAIVKTFEQGRCVSDLADITAHAGFMVMNSMTFFSDWIRASLACCKADMAVLRSGEPCSDGAFDCHTKAYKEFKSQSEKLATTTRNACPSVGADACVSRFAERHAEVLALRAAQMASKIQVGRS